MVVIKTAILQTHVYMDKSRNITQAAEILARPELQGIDLAVLPEMFCHQNRLTAAANEHTDSHRHPHFGLIIFYHDFYFWHDE